MASFVFEGRINKKEQETRKIMPGPFKFDNTLGVIDKIGSDFNKARRIYEVVLQVIFLGYYSYNVWKNENLVSFIINIVLLSLFSIYFILYLFTFLQKGAYEKAIRQKGHRYLTDFKILARLFTVGFSIYEIVSVPDSGVDKMFLLVAVIGFALQVLLRLLQMAFAKYSHMLIVSVGMDVEAFNGTALGKAVEAASSPGRTFFKVINKGLSKIDVALHGEKESPVIIDEDEGLKKEIDTLGLAEKARSEEKKKAKKEAKDQRYREEKRKSKELLSNIIPKKKKKEKKEDKAKELPPPKE